MSLADIGTCIVEPLAVGCPDDRVMQSYVRAHQDFIVIEERGRYQRTNIL